MTANAFGTTLTSPLRGSRGHSDIVERSAYGMSPSVTASVLMNSLPVANLPVLEVTRLTNTMNATESAKKAKIKEFQSVTASVRMATFPVEEEAWTVFLTTTLIQLIWINIAINYYPYHYY